MAGKRLLKNVLANTGSQNRLQEEREMWRQRALELSSRWERRRRSPVTRGRLVSDTFTPSPPRVSSPPPTSTHHYLSSPEAGGYWTKRLLQQEEKDPSRWGHSGYKELYAEEFMSSESEESERGGGGRDREKTGHHKKRHKHKHKEKIARKRKAKGRTKPAGSGLHATSRRSSPVSVSDGDSERSEFSDRERRKSRKKPIHCSQRKKRRKTTKT